MVEIVFISQRLAFRRTVYFGIDDIALTCIARGPDTYNGKPELSPR